MAYHGCPIEPDDWTDGPNQHEPDCPECDGTGYVNRDDDAEVTCPRCDGSGYEEHEPLETDLDF